MYRYVLYIKKACEQYIYFLKTRHIQFSLNLTAYKLKTRGSFVKEKSL